MVRAPFGSALSNRCMAGPEIEKLESTGLKDQKSSKLTLTLFAPMTNPSLLSFRSSAPTPCNLNVNGASVMVLFGRVARGGKAQRPIHQQGIRYGPRRGDAVGVGRKAEVLERQYHHLRRLDLVELEALHGSSRCARRRLCDGRRARWCLCDGR